MNIRYLRWSHEFEGIVTTYYKGTLVTLTEVSYDLGLKRRLWHISFNNEAPCDAAENLRDAKRLAKRMLEQLTTDTKGST